MQGWQIFHAYDIRATAHPPTLTQESERDGGGALKMDYQITSRERGCYEQAAISGEGTQSEWCVRRGIQMLIW